jgi:release factor glutamine methyltransferase
MKKQEYMDIGLEAGLSPSQIEAVLCTVMNISREDFFKLSEISSKFIYEVQQVFFKLQSGASEEYTLEKANFYGRDFFVDERVLIPRNDTEVLVKVALEKFNIEIDITDMWYIDVGTGSACIPISIVEEMHPLKFTKAIALEISEDAMDVAIENIEKLSP